MVCGSGNTLKKCSSMFINSHKLYTGLSDHLLLLLPPPPPSLVKGGTDSGSSLQYGGPGPGEGSLGLKGLRGTLGVNRDEAGGDR